MHWSAIVRGSSSFEEARGALTPAETRDIMILTRGLPRFFAFVFIMYESESMKVRQGELSLLLRPEIS